MQQQQKRNNIKNKIIRYKILSKNKVVNNIKSNKQKHLLFYILLIYYSKFFNKT